MKFWFTADYHLGHSKIIEYCNRPFKNVNEMNYEIIKRHNEIIEEKDIVFHIGDFCFKNTGSPKALEYEKLLNGKLIFIRGNHDCNNSCKTILESAIIKYGGYEMNLVHNPGDYNPNYLINLVGHVHNRWKIQQMKTSVLLNVGVDIWNYYPISIKTINKVIANPIKNIKIIKLQEKRKIKKMEIEIYEKLEILEEKINKIIEFLPKKMIRCRNCGYTREWYEWDTGLYFCSNCDKQVTGDIIYVNSIKIEDEEK